MFVYMCVCVCVGVCIATNPLQVAKRATLPGDSFEDFNVRHLLFQKLSTFLTILILHNFKSFEKRHFKKMYVLLFFIGIIFYSFKFDYIHSLI